MELITLKSPREQDAMRRAGRITAQARALAGSMVPVRIELFQRLGLGVVGGQTADHRLMLVVLPLGQGVAARITAQARALAGSMVRPGVTTKEIDDAVRRFIRGKGGQPSFLGYGGFSGSACISVNEVVIHGIPSRHPLGQGVAAVVALALHLRRGGFQVIGGPADGAGPPPDHPMENLLVGNLNVQHAVKLLETVKALEAQLMMRHYKGFLE